MALVLQVLLLPGHILPREVHRLCIGGRKSQCPHSRTISSSAKDIISSIFKGNKPDKKEFCKGGAHSVLLTLGNIIMTLIIS